MDIKKLEDSAEGRTLDLHDSYFIKRGVVDEWDYVLSQLGVPEKYREDIFQVTVKIEGLSIEDYGEDLGGDE
jgi:hypothetical protein